MEQTFMTIHNLGPDANILFASESIADILGYQPSEVRGKSSFDYFHPDEVPFARSVHVRGIDLDKAAVLHYARILSRDGRWIGCECCFTVVYDVLVACTSIYRRNAKSERRAIEAPQIRRMFACSPRDPRYHMLEHLSPKFRMAPTEREPRAALILNRFTRNLTIMFATTSIAAIVGLSPEEIKDKNFYQCIQESSLPEAIKCLESAKANDSIAYLRFTFQDPRENTNPNNDSQDEASDDASEANDETGNSPRRKRPRIEAEDDGGSPSQRRRVLVKPEADDDEPLVLRDVPDISHPAAAPGYRNTASREASAARPATIELEAVVSCTSDGLVVVLRKARPPIPAAHPPLVPVDYREGLFAAPWGQQPVRPQYAHESIHTFQPPLLPQYMPLQEHVKDAGGPPLDVLMGSIRDVAVFAWGVVGINPAMAAYGQGLPSGEAHPPPGTAPRRADGSRTAYATGTGSCFAVTPFGPRPSAQPSAQLPAQPVQAPKAPSIYASADGLDLSQGPCSLQSSRRAPGWGRVPERAGESLPMDGHLGRPQTRAEHALLPAQPVDAYSSVPYYGPTPTPSTSRELPTQPPRPAARYPSRSQGPVDDRGLRWM